MSDLNSLIIFAHVIDANGFSKAARRLKMPTSTVSRRVAELEQALGVRLIERSTRSLRLRYPFSAILLRSNCSDVSVTSRGGWLPTTGITCFAKRYRRSSFVFFAHWPVLTAQYALHRSANVVIPQPCFVIRPV